MLWIDGWEVDISRGEIVVLGMHRSGTSCITGAMTLAGANAGSVDDMTDTSPQNPKGFFELKEMRQFCDDILFSAEADWWKVASLSLARVPHDVTRSAIWRAKRVVTELHETGPCIVKEPRLCLVLPVFIRATENPVVIHIFRNPVEVARSLRTRNGIGIMQGLALWEAYNRAAIINSEGLPYTKVNYRDLLDQPVVTLSTLIESLSSMGIEDLHQPDEGSLKEFVTGSLRHERTADENLIDYLTPSQLALWKLLGDQSRVEIESLPAVSDALNDTLIDLETTVRHIDESKQANTRTKTVLKELAETQSERKALKTERAALSVERDELQAERDRLTRELQTERDRLTRELQIAGDEKTAMAQEVVRLKKSLADRFAELSQLTRLLLDSEREHEKSTKHLDQQRLENRRLKQQVRQLMARSSLRTRLGMKSKLIKKQVARIETSELFNESWYESEYPDVKESDCRPAEHYLLHGAYEGRNPGPDFDSNVYLDKNPDVEEQGVNPLVHYLEYGRSENRSNR